MPNEAPRSTVSTWGNDLWRDVLTKRDDVLQPDDDSKRRTRVARVCLCGELRGRDEDDDEAELLERPA